MADNRILVRFPSVRGNEHNLSTGTNLERCQEYVQFIRDRFRSLMPSPRFKASDIAQWVGQSASYRGLCFILRDTDHNCEWLFGFSCSADSTSFMFSNYAWGNANSATMGVSFKGYSTTSWANPNVTNSPAPLIHFNPNYAGSTYAMGFNNTTELTYTGGDFTAPASSPYSALATFMPAASGRYHGIDLHNWTGGGTSFRFKQCVMFDLEKSVLSYNASYQANPSSHVVCMAGQKMYPTHAQGGLLDPTDTRQDAMVVFAAVSTATTWATLESSQQLFSVHVRPDGTTVDNTARPQNLLNDFTRQNYTSGGNVIMRKLQMGAGANIKGYLDPEIINESFPHNDYAFCYMPLAFPDDDNPMIKTHPQFTRFWKKETPFFLWLPEEGLPVA